MILQYLQTALKNAKYKLYKDGSYYGEIPGFNGVCANEATLESCREELASVLEDWVLIHIHQHVELPEVDGLSLTVKVPTSAAA